MRSIGVAAVLAALAMTPAAHGETKLDGSCELAGVFSTAPGLTLAPTRSQTSVAWNASGPCTGTLDGQAIERRTAHLRIAKAKIFVAGCAYSGGQQIPGTLTFVNGIADSERPFGAPVSDPSGDDYLDEHFTVVDPSGDDVPDPPDTVLVINAFAGGSALASGWLVTGGSGTGPIGVDLRAGGVATAALRYGVGSEPQTLSACAGPGTGPLPFSTTLTILRPLTG